MILTVHLAQLLTPACGDGAFLAAAAERIIKNTTNKTALKKRLQTEIYGVDVDAAVIAKCKNRLSAIAQKAGISTVKWNLRHGDCVDKKPPFLCAIALILLSAIRRMYAFKTWENRADWRYKTIGNFAPAVQRIFISPFLS